MNVGQQIMVGLGVLLAVWYMVASMYNRRLGVRIYRWLQEGVKGLGDITEAKWFGSSGSGARMVVARASRPFRRLEVAFLLESRELLPLWLFNRLRGRRDFMIVKADLRSVPHGELEILPAGDRRLAGLVRQRNRNPWAIASRPLPENFAAAWRGRDTDQLLAALDPFLQSDGASLRRISIARTSPHLIAEVDIPALQSAPVSEFLQRLTGVFLS